ncbi:hypothetical protein [Polaromonas glacialis]|uniref:hypothetical protein n=1 Tax=Polaromonas glacialis TaxID=866564 RepID=UPI000A0007DE|nr:hypothetical protein [Polaromonas glacialis]
MNSSTGKITDRDGSGRLEADDGHKAVAGNGQGIGYHLKTSHRHVLAGICVVYLVPIESSKVTH